MDGFLCVNKSKGVTSRDAVNVVQRLVRPRKVGHAGTLDPLATGVLVIAVGRATKLIQYVQQTSKEYVGLFELGKTSDTEDITGQVVEQAVSCPPDIEKLQAAIRPLTGQVLQRPPAFSALKVGGKRAYALARRGEQVELKPRPIVIHAIEVVRYEYPLLELKIVCGSGTYVRSIGRDIGEALGCGAVMSGLVRSAVGSFRLEDALLTDSLKSTGDVDAQLTPLVDGVANLPKVGLSEEQRKAVSYGQKLELDCEHREVAALSAGSGELLAVLTSTPSGYRPAVNFVGR